MRGDEFVDSAAVAADMKLGCQSPGKDIRVRQTADGGTDERGAEAAAAAELSKEAGCCLMLAGPLFMSNVPSLKTLLESWMSGMSNVCGGNLGRIGSWMEWWLENGSGGFSRAPGGTIVIE